MKQNYGNVITHMLKLMVSSALRIARAIWFLPTPGAPTTCNEYHSPAYQQQQQQQRH